MTTVAYPNGTETDTNYTNYWATGTGGVFGTETITNKRGTTTLSSFVYSFDADRRKIGDKELMTDPNEGATNTALYTWTYDALSRLMSETYDYNNDDSTSGSTTHTADDYTSDFSYDLNNNRLIKITDQSNDGTVDQTITSTCNYDNELKTEVATSSTGNLPTYSTTYGYDSNGSTTSMTRTGSGATSATYTYDLADWKRALLAKGNTPRHAELVNSRVANAFDSCGFKFWMDISASKLQSHLAELRADRRKSDDTVGRGISAQTFNFYLQAAKQFCRWMVRDGRASESPLAHLQGLNVKTDRRHDRRALSPDEMRWLLDVTNKAPERYSMTGEARAMLYRLAVETGLRAGELRNLTRGSFALEGDEPSVTIAAAYAKNRRQDKLPLKADTVTLLAKHFTAKMPQTQAFSLPIPNAMVDMIRADAAEARQAWIGDSRTAQEKNDREQSSFLAYCDEAGRKADFHALRHTFISNLAAGGVHPKTAQSLARHSTITLTMDRYSHVYRGELGKALNVLPSLSAPIRQSAVATGTDGKSGQDRLSPDLSLGGEVKRSSVKPGAVKAVAGEAPCEIEKPPKIGGLPRKNGEAGIRSRQNRQVA